MPEENRSSDSPPQPAQPQPTPFREPPPLVELAPQPIRWAIHYWVLGISSVPTLLLGILCVISDIDSHSKLSGLFTVIGAALIALWVIFAALSSWVFLHTRKRSVGWVVFGYVAVVMSGPGLFWLIRFIAILH